MIADTNWNRVSEARLANIPVHFGEVRSEEAHHSIDFNRFSTMIASRDNDAYNALVCTDFGPELGRSHAFQIIQEDVKSDRHALSFTLGGRPLTKPAHPIGNCKHSRSRDGNFRLRRCRMILTTTPIWQIGMIKQLSFCGLNHRER